MARSSLVAGGGLGRRADAERGPRPSARPAGGRRGRLAGKVLRPSGGYETTDGGTFEAEFRGAVSGAEASGVGAAVALRRQVDERRSRLRPVVRGRDGDAGRWGREPHGALCRLAGGAGPGLGERGGGRRMALPVIVAHVAASASVPRYELRMRTYARAGAEYPIWQLPAAASPHLRVPVRVAELRGRNLELIEHSVMRRVAGGGLRPWRAGGRRAAALPLGEDTALILAACWSEPSARRAAATTCAPWRRASRRWSAMKASTGSAWRCTVGGRGAYSGRCAYSGGWECC